MNSLRDMSFGQRLRRERQKRRWTQEELAKQLGTAKLTVIRWENDQAQPHPTMERALYELFGKTAETFGMTRPPFWNIPFERNPYFSGRDAVLSSLHKALVGGGQAALTQTQHALSGLGGIGKTQTAVEYAYRYAGEYDAVLWVRADSHELLASDFAALASILGLTKRAEEDQRHAISAVKRWLATNMGWLVIFDNVEDVDIVSSFLPTLREGAVLLTTRVRVRGKYVKKIDLDTLSQQESVHFLLRRAKLVEEDGDDERLAQEEREAVEELAELLGGLPLALEQAAAYIEEHDCSAVDYLTSFLKHRRTLLAQRGNFNKEDYPHSVATTWTLSFEQIERDSPASADLLSLCAFLHPDAIAEEIITEAASHLGAHISSSVSAPIDLDAIIRPLFAFSLVKRERQTKSLSLHRLVQAVVRDRMDEETRRQWVERAVRALNAVFPDGEFASWSRCERYLPHAQVCAALIEQEHIYMPEAASLLNRVGYYLIKRTRYAEAEAMLVQALATGEQVMGSEHLDTAEILNNLATVYRELCTYEKAEAFYQRALMIREQQPGLQHLATAATLHGLANLYCQQERFEEMESFALRALAIREQFPDSPIADIAQSLDDLGMFYYTWGKYEEAEPFVQRALAIREQVSGKDHPDTAESLNDLALIYCRARQYQEAEMLYMRSLTIFEQQFGLQHRYTTTVLNNLAQIYKLQGRYAEAATLWQKVRAIREQVLGPRHPDMANVLLYLATVYNLQGRYTEAEPLLHEALSIREQHQGAEHAGVAEILFNFAILYHGQQRYLEAEHALHRSLVIRQQQLGSEHLDTLHTLHSLILFYASQGRDEQAQALYGGEL